MYQWICDWYLNGEMVNMAGNKYRRLTPVALDFAILLTSKGRTTTVQILHFSNFI